MTFVEKDVETNTTNVILDDNKNVDKKGEASIAKESDEVLKDHKMLLIEEIDDKQSIKLTLDQSTSTDSHSFKEYNQTILNINHNEANSKPTKS